MANESPTMRAAVYREPRRIEVADVPVPDPGEDEVLIEVSHCGICGTDLHMALDGWGRPNSIGGHEYSGTIRAVGPRVRGWSVGDRVVALPQAEGCGSCRYCANGRPSLCLARGKPGLDAYQGAFAEFVKVSQRQLVRLPLGLTLRAAALCEPLAVAQHAVTLAGVTEADKGVRALVSGAGPIGALIVALLRADGVDDVVVSEPGAKRRELARRLGATVLEPARLARPPLPFDTIDEPFDVAFECSGRVAAVEIALAQLARGGRLVLIGTGTEHPVLDVSRILLNELTVTGAFNYDADGFASALARLASGRLPVDLLLEPADVPLEGITHAMEQLHGGALAGKVLVCPRA